VRQPNPDDDFEHFAPSRFDDQGSAPGPVRPDWLTRVDDEGTGHAPHGVPAAEPPARPSRPVAPRPAAPRPTPSRPAGPGAGTPGTVVPGNFAPHAGAPLDPDSFAPHAGAPRDPDSFAPHPGAPRDSDSFAPHAGAPRDPDSWEGAVERVELHDEDPPGFVVTSRSGGVDLGAIQATVTRVVTSKPFLVLVLALGAVMAVMMFRPRDAQTTSIASIRRHPERFEGRAVQVSGRVGEVFTVGGGYAFHLHQGRENIVVFTRSRVPVRSEKVTISGSLSIGTLDGKTRHALFETAR